VLFVAPREFYNKQGYTGFMHFELRDNKWIIFLATSAAYFVLEKIFNVATNFVGGLVTLNFIPLNLIDAIFIILILVGIPLFLYDKIYMRNKGKKETTIPVYEYANLPRLTDILSDTKKEIKIVGVTLENLNHIRSEIAETLKRAKVRVLVFLPDPDSKFDLELMDRVDELVRSADTKKRIESAISMLIQMYNELGSIQQKENLKIKTYNRIPSNSLIIIDSDPETKSGTMQIEPYPFNTPQGERRILKVSQKKTGKDLQDLRYLL
jgi:vacuolar-type H+-ATPase subunit F/Vma7